jgi:hypothetical protein
MSLRIKRVKKPNRRPTRGGGYIHSRPQKHKGGILRGQRYRYYR